MTIQHSAIESADAHEPKNFSTATSADAGKTLTPSSSTDGVSVLRKLASEEISYNNTVSGLTATDAKAAIDELTTTTTAQGDGDGVTYDNTASSLTATDVQAAIDEVAARDELTTQADVVDLGQTISATYVDTEVQAISDKVDQLLASLRLANILA